MAFAVAVLATLRRARAEKFEIQVPDSVAVMGKVKVDDCEYIMIILMVINDGLLRLLMVINDYYESRIIVMTMIESWSLGKYIINDGCKKK